MEKLIDIYDAYGEGFADKAPYLVSRCDVSTGERIVPQGKRSGMLDRKLRIVNENTDTYDAWLKWLPRTFEATYGYEYQGDNVLLRPERHRASRQAV